MKKIEIIQYKWAGNWGPFNIKIECGECSLSEEIIENIIGKKFPNADISFTVLPWLDNWYKVLFKGGWHAPIVLLNGKMISQGVLIDFQKLEEKIKEIIPEEYVEVTDEVAAEPIDGKNVVFSKIGCPFCEEAKKILKEKNISFEERSVVKNPAYAEQMFDLVKPHYPKNKPITVPQIFLNGEYFGTAEEVKNASDEFWLTIKKNKND